MITLSATYRGLLPLSLLFLMACGQAGPFGMNEFEVRLLKAIADDDDPRNQLCVPAAVGRPVDRGVEGVRFESVPGAYRVVIANGSGTSWRMVDGYAAMLLFTSAGFFKSTPIDVTGPEGVTVPAVAFELTRKGYEAMGTGDCFLYGKPKSVKVHMKEEEPNAAPQIKSLGKIYRVQYSLEAERLPWADTTEFTYVYTKVYNTLSTGSTKAGVFVDTGKEILSGARLQATMGQRAAAIKETIGPVAFSSVEGEVHKLLNTEEGRMKIAPCLEIPLRGASSMQGVYDKGPEVAAVFIDSRTSGQQDANRAAALEFFGKLEKAGLAKANSTGAQVRYVLEPAAAESFRSSKRQCIPLGEAKLETLIISGSMARTTFRGWASVTSPLPWSAALSEHFPGVAAALRDGFGVQGSLRASPFAQSGKSELDAVPKLAQFGAKPKPHANAFVPFSAERVKLLRERKLDEAAVDLPGYSTKVAFDGKPPCVSADGTTVSSGKNRGCATYRASRGYTSGKVYAELAFSSEFADGKPNTWTNAAFTSKRFLSSVSTGAGHFSFAGSFNKHLLKSGDLIGIAADLDQSVIYWHVNGVWRTGRPASGLGEPILDMGTEHFLAVSVQGGDKGERESWTANFGESPFKYPPPEGFKNYSATVRGAS